MISLCVENIRPLFCLIWAQYAHYVLLGVRDGLCLACLVISGAVKFLFEGQFGTILHTGDCRLTPDCIQDLPMKYITKKGNENICRLDFVFLDCTFSKCFLKLPSKESAIRQVVLCAVIRYVLHVPCRSVLLTTGIVTIDKWFSDCRLYLAYGSIHMHCLFSLLVIFLGMKIY